jgi:uncharacterized protein
MDCLFRIETDRVSLEWAKPRGKVPVVLAVATAPPGRLVIRQKRRSLQFGPTTWRSEVPPSVANDPQEVAGPRLYEQTDYTIVLRSSTGHALRLENRDPLLLRDVRAFGNGEIVHGVVNFGSQVGRSEFLIFVGGEPEFEFEVEIFPSKLDYLTDYQRLLADVQDILTGLVLEYLRSTFRLGFAVPLPQPTHLEWLTLLRHVMADLERALVNISRQPIRATSPTIENTRSDRVRKVGSPVRAQVLRGGGVGQLATLSSGILVREHLNARVAHCTLDTPEHRWLANQLGRIRRRLAELIARERDQEPSSRRAATTEELRGFETKVSELLRLEPFKAASGGAPPGFASIQLLSAPGYQEAYKYCLVLSLALRLSGGPVRLAVKDLSLLYEYWCYLATLRLVGELTGKKMPVRKLLAVEQDGLRVLLQKGKENTVAFELSEGRRLAVTYNPRFQNDALLVAQQPDMILSLFDRDWPAVRLVVDAKYRVESSKEYVERYGSAGPPDDALNVLHRYRDAILDSAPAARGGFTPKRTVIEGVAVYPYRKDVPGMFRRSRLWESVQRLGIGAIPALPGETEYLREWLAETLRLGGWAIAEKAIAHRSHERAFDWRVAAAEAVLIGVLRADNEEEHLNWILRTRNYYLPKTKQPRQYNARYVALYLPTALRQPGAVAYWASVESLDVVERSKISTPWSSQQGDQQQVLYRLEPIHALVRPVENRRKGGQDSGLRSPRWTSRLALQRASNLQELLLETEPEWRLFEDLRPTGYYFEVEPGRVKLMDPEDPRGRAVFVVGNVRVQHRGAAGFAAQLANLDEQYLADASDVLEFLKNERGPQIR